MGEIKEIKTKADFDQALQDAGGKAVLVDFFAVWCGPCRAIAPFLAECAKKYENVIVLKVDVDQVSEVAEAYDVTAMPTFMLFKNGKKADSVTGANRGALDKLFKDNN